MFNRSKMLLLITIQLAHFFVPHTLFSRVSPEKEKQIINFCVEKGVKKYIERKVDSAKVSIEPFPYIIIDEILPQSLYALALDYWPGFDHFRGAGGSRKKIYTTYGCIEKTNIIEEKRIFWRTFGEVVIKHYLKPLIIEKFKPYIGWKFPLSSEEELKEIKRNLSFYPYHYDCIVVDPPGYRIAPHIDGIKTFIQAIIYFPKDDDHQELGTVLYKGSSHKKPLNEQKGNAIIEHNNDLVPAKKIAYKPNTFIAFLQSPVSWHSTNPVANPDIHYLRRTYFLDIRLSPEAMQKIYREESPLSEIYLHDFSTLFPENW